MSHDEIGALFETVLRTYATCSSYEDTGEVWRVIAHGPRPWDRQTSRQPFLTAFERSGRFRFEFRDMALGPESEWSRYVVWSDGSQFQSWSTLQENLESHESLDAALAGPTGVSGGSARAIPALLMPELVWRPLLPDPAETQLIGMEQVDGAECIVLRSSPRDFDPVQFWIDASSHAIRRTRAESVHDDAARRRNIELVQADTQLAPEMKAQIIASMQEHVASDFTSETITHYRPRFDSPIDSARWGFEPPV